MLFTAKSDWFCIIENVIRIKAGIYCKPPTTNNDKFDAEVCRIICSSDFNIFCNDVFKFSTRFAIKSTRISSVFNDVCGSIGSLR
jgi:hypothetical protein